MVSIAIFPKNRTQQNLILIFKLNSLQMLQKQNNNQIFVILLTGKNINVILLMKKRFPVGVKDCSAHGNNCCRPNYYGIDFKYG